MKARKNVKANTQKTTRYASSHPLSYKFDPGCVSYDNWTILRASGEPAADPTDAHNRIAPGISDSQNV